MNHKLKKINFCKSCLYSDLHPLGITINDNGICSGCLIHEEKNKLNWSERFNLLKKIIKDYKSKNKNNYDCVIPVTGSQDSYYTVHLAVNKLGLKPLLVSYNKYFNTPLGIRNLSNLRIKFDCDILFQNINPISVKKIIKYTLSEMGNFYWPILAGHTVLPVQIATKYKIPLIIWGAHQGLEQVGMFSHKDNVEMTRRYREDHDLFGFEADKLLKFDNNLKEEDVWQYHYPDDYTLNSLGVRGIYLGNFFRWDPLSQHIDMTKMFNYKSSKFARTFDVYDNVDCFNYMNLHDYLKLCKYGYSKVTDHATREIRHGRITREQGIKLVKKFELEDPQYVNLFCEWLGMDMNSLNFIIKKFKNKRFWEETDTNKWNFKGLSSIIEVSENTSNKLNKIDELFNANSSLEHNLSASYVTFGKGYDGE
ncbi:N-acetyl sugar amidotransferase [Pelagibacteraceae bacterium]|jgi:N-acetyl sugar amidotransferase|nr:N-acetyl sugar amidotransferase [Pelagibacteraceae bacterium]